MEKIKLQDIVAVAGFSGLYKIIGRSRTGIIVESLDGSKKRMSVTLSTKVSVLSEIAMFSREDDINLGIIFLTLQREKPVIPAKNSSPADLKKFMSVALPDFDEERVYLSHIQKLANWFGIIGDILDYEDLKKTHFPEENTENATEKESSEPATDEKKEKKSTKKKDTEQQD